jgi:hypothetical protein
MAIGTSIFLIALGAIFYWAVEFDVAGLRIDTIGVILMVVGVLGLIITMIMLLQGGGRADTTVRRERYVERDDRPPRV